jgi:hypothetical protein
VFVFVSAGSRFVAWLSNATFVPSPLIDGLSE